MAIQVGDVVSILYHSTTTGYRRVNTDTVSRVMKSFIELNNGSRYNPITFVQIQGKDKQRFNPKYSIDVDNSCWDRIEDQKRAKIIRKDLFDKLASSASNENWGDVQSNFQALLDVMKTCE